MAATSHKVHPRVQRANLIAHLSTVIGVDALNLSLLTLGDVRRQKEDFWLQPSGIHSPSWTKYCGRPSVLIQGNEAILLREYLEVLTHPLKREARLFDLSVRCISSIIRDRSNPPLGSCRDCYHFAGVTRIGRPYSPWKDKVLVLCEECLGERSGLRLIEVTEWPNGRPEDLRPSFD